VIIRILGDGQYQAPESLAGRLDGIDALIDTDLLAGDPGAFREHLAALIDLVRAEGTRLEEDVLAGSDIVIPPADITLDELRALIAGEGPGTGHGGDHG
jgi:hypothetical protein